MAKFQASTRDPRDKPSVFSKEAQYKPPHSLWSENSETFDKKVWKKREKPQKTSDSLDNLCVKGTHVDGALEVTLERVPCIRYPTTFWEKSVSALLDSRTKFVICLSSPWAVQTSIAIRSTEFASKKEGDDCNIKLTGVTYKFHPGY